MNFFFGFFETIPREMAYNNNSLFPRGGWYREAYTLKPFNLQHLNI